MPVVRTYRSPQGTALQPLPGPRRQPASSAQGLAEVGNTLANVGLRGYQEYQQKAQAQADETALTEFDGQLANWEHQNLYDPQSGVLNTVKGKDAVGLSESLSQKFDQFSGDLLSTLNPRQQQAALRQVARRRQGIVSELDHYGSKEAAQYDESVVDASLKTSVQLAIANAANPGRVNEELQRQALIVSGYADRQGLPPEVRDQKLAELHSATHVGVIDQLLATNQDQAAQAYFDATKDQITGDKLTAVERALEEGSLRGMSQQQADQILATANTDGEAQDAVRAIEDPKLRDQVDERVQRGLSLRKQAAREQTEQHMIDAGNIIDRAKTVKAIPPAVWVTFTPQEKASLEAYAKRNQVAADPEGKTDLATYYGLMQQASADPEKFAQTNLLLYLGKIGKTEFKQLTELQNSIRKGDKPKAEQQLDGFRTNERIVSDALALADIKDDKVKALFNQELDQQVQQLQRLTGKKASNDDVQRLADGILTKAVAVPESWYWRALGYPIKGKRLLDVTVSDIPTAQRKQIEQSLQKHGIAVTDAAILQTYIDAQLAGKK